MAALVHFSATVPVSSSLPYNSKELSAFQGRVTVTPVTTPCGLPGWRCCLVRSLVVQSSNAHMAPNQMWQAILLDHMTLHVVTLSYILCLHHIVVPPLYFAPSSLQMKVRRPPPLRQSNKKREASTRAGRVLFCCQFVGEKSRSRFCATTICLMQSA